MKNTVKITTLVLLIAILCSCFVGAIPGVYATTGTGYTSADDVEYVTSGSYVANWGARGETATFLSPMALEFYTGDNTLEKFVALEGGSSIGKVPQSDLYRALQSFMKSKHKKITTYAATNDLYKYTDCQLSDTSYVYTIYSNKKLSGVWDGGSTWNKEHVWPKSKCLQQNTVNDGADIMQLRPESPSTNSNRGNTAFGTSSGYYHLAKANRGDIARILLYCYVRWGNDGAMWGQSGVIESKRVLLKWMEEDPVDTWEMGRNDAVQSITGTRNVFVDYPELVWILFDDDIPTDIDTPSGYAKNQSNENPFEPPVDSNPSGDDSTIWLIVGIVGGVVVIGGVAVVIIVVSKRRKNVLAVESTEQADEQE